MGSKEIGLFVGTEVLRGTAAGKGTGVGTEIIGLVGFLFGQKIASSFWIAKSWSSPMDCGREFVYL